MGINLRVFISFRFHVLQNWIGSKLVKEIKSLSKRFVLIKLIMNMSKKYFHFEPQEIDLNS